jgi:hypothetical protein
VTIEKNETFHAGTLKPNMARWLTEKKMQETNLIKDTTTTSLQDRMT